MFKIMYLVVTINLLLQSIPIKAQPVNNIFYRRSIAEAVVTFSGFQDQLIQGNFRGVKATVRPIKDGIFFGGEGFISESEVSFSNVIIDNSSKTIIAGFGPVIGFLKPTSQIVSDIRLNFGLMHISQNSKLILIGLFQSLKFIQVQNDWLTYIESLNEITRGSRILNRLIVGMRYEYPLESVVHASLNGDEVNIPTTNRKNFQIWSEIGLASISLNKKWLITAGFQGGYRHFSQNITDAYKTGILFYLANTKSTVVWLSYSKEFNPRHNKTMENYSLSVDIMNLNPF